MRLIDADECLDFLKENCSEDMYLAVRAILDTCNTVKAVPLEKIKQAKEEIESHKYDEGEGFDDFSDGYIRGLFAAARIVHKLIIAQGESEETNGRNNN